jgi:hypothetical protein
VSQQIQRLQKEISLTKLRNQNNSRPTAVRLNSKLERNLAAYITAAGAAGVAVLAAAQPADAKVVYTAANTKLNFGSVGMLPLDLNNDGTADLTFFGGSASVGYGDLLGVYGDAGGVFVGANNSASALVWGARVGPKDMFSAGAAVMAEVSGCHASTCGYRGKFIKTHDRYLGVRFSIHGQSHYGWVSVNVGNDPSGAVLTGYAYETIPNKPIIAGEKSGPVVAEGTDLKEMPVPSPQPAILGVLAQGADALSIWRREDRIQ